MPSADCALGWPLGVGKTPPRRPELINAEEMMALEEAVFTTPHETMDSGNDPQGLLKPLGGRSMCFTTKELG